MPTEGADERALVVGASGGIGAALVAALPARGAEVVPLSRRDDGLDVTDEGSVARALGGLSGPFDTVLVATGALSVDGHGPEKALRDLDAEGLAALFAINAMGPALMLKHLVPLIPRDRRCAIGVLSARVGSIGDNRLGGWHGYRAAKAALNMILRGAAIELARSRRHAVLAALHPGTVATPFTRDYPHHDKVPPGTAAANLLAVLDGLTPADSGRFMDYAGKEIPW